MALGARIRLDRIFEHTMRSVIDVDTSSGQNPVVAEGDIVTVATILDRYKRRRHPAGQCGLSRALCMETGHAHPRPFADTRDLLVTRDYYRRLNALGSTNAQNYSHRTQARYRFAEIRIRLNNRMPPRKPGPLPRRRVEAP